MTRKCEIVKELSSYRVGSFWSQEVRESYMKNSKLVDVTPGCVVSEKILNRAGLYSYNTLSTDTEIAYEAGFGHSTAYIIVMVERSTQVVTRMFLHRVEV